MEYTINNSTWNIYEKSSDEIMQYLKSTNEYENGSIYLGITIPTKNEIWIDKELPITRKKKVLVHELAHSYIIDSIGLYSREYSEENVCDLVSNCFEIIKLIITEYFEKYSS